MKNIKPLLAICIVILFCSFAVADWVNLQSKEGRFTMKFPRQPTLQTQNLDNEAFPIKMYMFVYDATKYKDDNIVYLAMYCDYPDTLVNSDFRDEIVDTILNGSINGMANTMDGKITSAEKINYKGFPGKKIKLSLKDGQGYAYVKIYLVHNRMYMMEVACEPNNDHNASINKFFDSFALLESKPTPKKPAGKH